jgi:hypothetical protein
MNFIFVNVAPGELKSMIKVPGIVRLPVPVLSKQLRLFFSNLNNLSF